MGMEHSLTAVINFKPNVRAEDVLVALKPLSDYFEWEAEKLLDNDYQFEDSRTVAMVMEGDFVRSLTLESTGEVRHSFPDFVELFADNLSEIAQADYCVLRDYSTGDIENAVQKYWYGTEIEMRQAMRAHAWGEAQKKLHDAGISKNVIQAIATIGNFKSNVDQLAIDGESIDLGAALNAGLVFSNDESKDGPFPYFVPSLLDRPLTTYADFRPGDVLSSMSDTFWRVNEAGMRSEETSVTPLSLDALGVEVRPLNPEEKSRMFAFVALKDLQRDPANVRQSPAVMNDGRINEITMDLLGKWPSFSAQSWACKVVHAVLASPSVDVEAQLSSFVLVPVEKLEDWRNDLSVHGVGDIEAAADMESYATRAAVNPQRDYPPLAATHALNEQSDVLKIAKYALEYIDALPKHLVLPTMPGFDRDWADDVIARATNNVEKPKKSSVENQGPEI